MLHHHLPQGANDKIQELRTRFPLIIKITKPRKTKLGDYRPAQFGKPAQITINNNLNPYSFLITLLHEYAHHFCWKEHGGKVAPHGKEWKGYYIKLLKIFLDLGVFPFPLSRDIHAHLNNPPSSSCFDISLTKALKEYDKPKPESETIHVEDLQPGQKFSYQKKRVFIVQEKSRKRYRCMEESTRKIFTFHPLAEVIPIN